MNLAKILPVVFVSFALAAPVWAAPKYGDASIVKGSLTVVRSGKRYQYREGQGTVPVQEQDLLRVGPKSRVLLDTPEKAKLTLGSNAVMHVKPWQRQQKQGFLRMLFGRVRSSVAKLTGGEQFNLKTATATIGVKGTEFDTTQDSNQNVWTFTREGLVEFSGLEGPPVDIAPGTISVVVNGKGATPPAPLPPQMAAVVEELDAPEPTDESAGDLAGGDELVETGIVEQEELEESKQEEPPEEPTTTTGGSQENTEETTELVDDQASSLDDAQQAAASAGARLDIRFEK